jgi:hypothetical protein
MEGYRKLGESQKWACPTDFQGECPPDFAYDQAGGAGAREQSSGDTMIKIVYEELIIQIDNEELARLLGLEPGFTLQHIEEAGMDFQLIFGRKADSSKTLPRREERKGLFE